MIKYFITKDFIGWPTGIVSAKYDTNGIKVSGYSEAPRNLSRFKGKCFDTLEEILKYRYCACHKVDCNYNTEVWNIVNTIKNK